MWGLGTLLLEIASGLPLEIIEKSKIITLNGKTSLAQGAFCYEENEKTIRQKKTKTQELI